MSPTPKEEKFDSHIPTILTKDDLVINLILSEIKSLKKDMDEIKSNVHEHSFSFNEFRLEMSKFSNIDIKALNKLLTIDPDSVTETIHSVNTLINVNKIVLPILLTIIFTLTFLGLKQYVRDDSQTIQSIKPISQLVIEKERYNHNIWGTQKGI